MKIVMFTNTYLPHVGGVARSVHVFATDLRRLGHAVLIVAPHFNGETEDDDDVLRVPAIQNFNGSDFSVRIPLPFIVEKTIQRFQPDIIHSHHPFLMGDTALRIARKHGLPLIFTHHTVYDQYSHYVPVKSQSLRQFIINIVTSYTDFCDHVIAPSKSIAEMLKSRGVTRPVVDIPTGVDTDFFAKGDGPAFRRDHGIPAQAPVVGHLGRLAPEKNLAYLARSVVESMRRQPDIYFLVVGAGPANHEIEGIFTKAGVGDHLIMAGEKTGLALASAYHAMDLFVFSSLTETQGMVLTEAMAAGIPVIALDAPGSREVVTDHINGRLLPADCPTDQFAQTIASYFEDKNQQKQWKATVHDTARQFARDTCARRLAALYAQAQPPHRNHVRPEEDNFLTMDSLMMQIKTEWDLLAQKTQAAAEAIQKTAAASRP